MKHVTEDWILEMSPKEREVYLDDVDALDKVKPYNSLPNTELMNTRMVAEWFEVTDVIIRNLFNLNRRELENSGAKTLRGEELNELREEVGDIPIIGNAITVFPKRAVLNVALLLRKSEVAKKVRLTVLGEEFKIENSNLPVKYNAPQTVEYVNFNGNKLVAVKMKDDGKIYIGVRWVCEGIGLSRGQMNNETVKIKEDLLLSQGARNLVLPTKGGSQEVLCLHLKFLPMWLARIAITPNMQKSKPELTTKLLSYQMDAAEVLERVFVNKESFIVPTTQKEALQMMLDQIEENEMLQLENEGLKPKAEFYDITADAKGAELIVNTAKVLGIGEVKMFEFLRQTKVLYKEGRYSIPRQEYLNSGYFEVVTGYRNLTGWHEQTFTTKLTEEGKRFVYRLVKKYGGGKRINELMVKEIADYVKTVNEQLGYKEIS